MIDKENRRNLLGRWWVFTIERFNPISYLVLIIFYFAANALVALKSLGLEPSLGKEEVLGWIAVLLFFFHLRVFDEIKDYDVDRIAHRDRPLARGLISLREARAVAAFLIVIEVILGAFIGLPAFVAVCLAIFYSFLMYKEFFVGEWLRKRLTAYAITHTLVTCFLSLFIFSCVTGRYLWDVSVVFGWLVLANWTLSNVFEFSRKTFAAEEEKDFLDSYSRMFGSIRAALLVLFLIAFSVFIAFVIGISFGLSLVYFLAMGLFFFVALLVSVLYSVHNDLVWAKAFRAFGSLFIVLYYIAIALGVLLVR